MSIPVTGSLLQDILRQRHGEFILGRTEAQEAFRQSLAEEQPERAIFLLSGPAGVGKTTLARAFCHMAEESGALVGWADELQTSALRTMVKLGRDLACAGAPLTHFRERYEAYQRLTQRISSDPYSLLGLADIRRQFTRYFPLRPLGGLELAEVALTDVIPGQRHVGLRYLGRLLDSARDLTLLQYPGQALLGDFVHGLNKWAEKRPIVLVLDSYEHTAAFLAPWLESVLKPEYALSPQVRLVIASREELASPEWEARRPFLRPLPLGPLTSEETASCAREFGVQDETQSERIYELTGGTAGPVAMLASSLPEADPQADMSQDAADQFLSWIDQPGLRQLVLWSAIPRRWNRRLLEYLLGDEAIPNAHFDWLVERPFVQSTRNDWCLVPFARSILLSHIRTHDPETFSAMHQRVLDYHTEASRRLAGDSDSNWWDPKWIAHRAERVYHALCVHPMNGIGDAAGELLEALQFHPTVASLFMAAWQAAAEDTADADLMEWLLLIQECASRMDAEGWPAFEELYERLDLLGGLTEKTRAMIFIGQAVVGQLSLNERQLLLTQAAEWMPNELRVPHVSALLYLREGKYDAARDACSQALVIDASYTPARVLSGDVCLMEGRIERATGEYQAALRGAPDYYALEPVFFRLADALVGQNSLEAALDHYLRAFPDKTPDERQAIAHLERGTRQHTLGRFDEACRDYINASGLGGGKSNWMFNLFVALTSAHRLRGEHLQALDYGDRAFAWLLERSKHALGGPGREGLVAAHNNRGNARLVAGDCEGAVWDYDQALLREREVPHLYCNRGLAYLIQHMAPRAEVDFDAAMQRSVTDKPFKAISHFFMGVACADQGRLTEGRDYFKKASRIDPSHPVFIHNTGLAYYHLHYLRRAIAWFRWSIQVAPDHALSYYHRGLCHLESDQLSRARADLDRAIHLFENTTRMPGQPASAYLDRGLARFESGDFEGAIEDYEHVRRLLKRDRIVAVLPPAREGYRLDRFGFPEVAVPQDAQALYRLGEVYAAIGQQPQALRCYTEALELAHDDYPEAYGGRARCLAAMKRHQAAVEDYLEALKRVPNDSALHVALGQTYRKLRRLEEASQAFDQAIRLVPTNSEAYLQMGHVKLAQGHAGKAIDSYRMAELFGRRDAELYLGRGDALFARGQLEEAMADYNRALRLKPSLAPAHWGRARTNWKTGRPLPAVENAFTALGFTIQNRLRAILER